MYENARFPAGRGRGGSLHERTDFYSSQPRFDLRSAVVIDVGDGWEGGKLFIVPASHREIAPGNTADYRCIL